ncbi:SixA phosphatase family protein [Mycobacterium sp.]|uniref:SixA phosphatase family protein n=1 Tax=Mycobacterium sp. TaxID=1785 RepID=UPI003A8357C3
MRHAKSAYPGGVADHDRPLAPRGRKEAALGGDWLRANVPAIDATLCSTAIRARETLECTRIDAPVSYVPQIYGAAPGAVIETINQVDAQVNTLLAIGHEPTMSSLALILANLDTADIADGAGSAAAQSISAKFPTSGIAVVHCPGTWADLEPGGAALADFHVPR